MTHKGRVVKPFLGEWGESSTGGSNGGSSALGKCVGNKGSEGESSDEGSHRSFLYGGGCFASVWRAASGRMRT
jgi:hypothetical protein